MCRTPLLAVMAFALSCVGSVHAQEWGCYDPKPGHPTAAEKQAFIEDVSAQAGSRAWIAAIANPYNWRPAEYTKTVTRFMNDPASPSEQVSPDRNLYRLSTAIAAATSQAAASAAVQDPYAVTREYFASKLG